MPTFSITTYAIAGLAILLALAGLYIKHQNNEIIDLKVLNQQYVVANEDMSKKINDQNDKLREGELKYNDVQSKLDKANGKNEALTQKYEDLRKKLGERPVPQSCPESIKDLKDVLIPLATEWNKQ